jgi:hypothetical protein
MSAIDGTNARALNAILDAIESNAIASRKAAEESGAESAVDAAQYAAAVFDLAQSLAALHVQIIPDA